MLPQEKLKELRKARGLTTYELGQLCGIHQSTISKLENGKRRLDIEALSKLAKALKVNVNEIIDEDLDNEELRHKQYLEEDKKSEVTFCLNENDLEDISFRKENLKDQVFDKGEDKRVDLNEQKHKNLNEGYSEEVYPEDFYSGEDIRRCSDIVDRNNKMGNGALGYKNNSRSILRENSKMERSFEEDNIKSEGIESLSLKENPLENRINGEPVVKERDVTKEFNNIMGKFYSNEGGPLFFNGAELDGENMELFEQALKVAIRTVKQRNKENKQKR